VKWQNPIGSREELGKRLPDRVFSPDLAKSDARITTIIKVGIKGEMPAFAKKFTDSDVQALIAYLRTLNDSD